MQLLTKRWRVKDPNPQLQVQLSNALGVHPIVAQLLINRNIIDLDEAERFLKADLSKLYDPFLFKDMDVAVERIQQAKQNNETVLIYGDYDVDGVTSSVVLNEALKKIGIRVLHYIPHRMEEGYGLNLNVVTYAKENNVGLLISVDCGINAFEVVESLNQEHVDSIVIDHHEPSSEGLPKSVAIINPKRKDCRYPFKGMASVGLVAKLAQALLGRFPEENLDLVSIGTIADVSELKGENRIFVKTGLPKIHQTKNKGLLALIDVSKIKGKPFKPYFVGFILGPRINATGRMDSAYVSLELFLSDDLTEAYRLAKKLEENNKERQKIQQKIVQEAMQQVEQEVNFSDQRIIVLFQEGWHKGVLGIVASRIVEKYYRPTIVMSLEEGVAVGSARSIEGFHLFEALAHCEDHLENYGGHKMAAGLTIREEKIDSFRNQVNAFAQENMTIDSLVPSVDLDGEVPLSQISLELVKTVDALEPFGQGNRTPVFCSRQLTVKNSAVILGKDTLKFWVTDGQVVVQVVGFGMGKYQDLVNQGEKIDIAYSLSIDDWNKDPIVSLRLKDIKLSI